jgi:hypothetical protein
MSSPSASPGELVRHLACPCADHAKAAMLKVKKSDTVTYYRCVMKIKDTEDNCSVIGYDITKRDLTCCVCSLVFSFAGVMFKHPTEPLPFQKLKYCHRMCYNEARSPQKARFPGRCPNCRCALKIGDSIEPHDGGRLWRHIGCSASAETAPPNALMLHQLAASAVLCVDDGDFDLSSSSRLSFEEPAPKRVRNDDNSAPASSQDSGNTDGQTQD